MSVACPAPSKGSVGIFCGKNTTSLRHAVIFSNDDWGVLHNLQNTIVFPSLANIRQSYLVRIGVKGPPKGLLRRYLWVQTPTQKVCGRLG